MTVADDNLASVTATGRASLSGPDTEVHPLKDALIFTEVTHAT